MAVAKARAVVGVVLFPSLHGRHQHRRQRTRRLPRCCRRPVPTTSCPARNPQPRHLAGARKMPCSAASQCRAIRARNLYLYQRLRMKETPEPAATAIGAAKAAQPAPAATRPARQHKLAKAALTVPSAVPTRALALPMVSARKKPVPEAPAKPEAARAAVHARHVPDWVAFC